MAENSMRILYLEDSKADFHYLKALLESNPKWQFSVDWAVSNEEALSKCRTESYDLFILDYHLRNKLATDFIEEFKALHHNTPPFIFISSEEHHEEEIDREAMKFGAIDYVHKGNFDHVTLARVMRYAIMHHKLEKSLHDSEKELSHVETHDRLTGTANRVVFLDHLNLAIQRMKRSRKPYVVMMIDLDRFKWINDSLGHAAGDELLQIVTEKLSTIIRPSDTLARFGGDEFAVLMEELSPDQQIPQSSMIAMRFLEILSQPFSIRGQTVYTSASIGIVLGNELYDNADQVIRDADLAMYRAKDTGKGCYQYYDSGMHEEAVENLRIASDLQIALNNEDELVMFYQPLIDMRSHGIIGYESLIRWQHPKRGLLAPGAFLKQAEESGMMDRIGDYVLKHSCEEFSAFLNETENEVYISINLAAEQIINHRIIDDVRLLLAQYAIAPQCLQIEITENSIMKSPDLAKKILSRLRDMGVKIAIDDFGSGYSSLSYLQKFPVTTIKIDKSFVTHIEEQKENREIVRMITVLAKAIGADVIAEGVETESDQNVLLDLGCVYAQGYYYGRPQRNFLEIKKEDRKSTKKLA